MFGAVVGIGDYPDCGHNDKYTLAFSLRLFFSHHKNPQNSRIEKFIVGDNLEKMLKDTERITGVAERAKAWSQRRKGLKLLYPRDVTRIIQLALREVEELKKARDQYDLETPQVLEEIPDPILYLLQALRYYEVETDNFLQQCLETRPPTNQITTEDLELTSKELKSKRIKRTRVEWMEKLITMIGHFCSQHSIDLLRLLEIKIMYNEIRFDEEFGFQTRHLAGRDRKQAKQAEFGDGLKRLILYQLLEYYLEDKESHIDGETKEVPPPRPPAASGKIFISTSP